MYGKTYGHLPAATAVAPQTGRYRIKAQVKAINSPNKPLPLLLNCREEYGRSDDDVRGVYDLKDGETREIELDVQLRRREMIVFTPWSLPDVRHFTQPKVISLDSYTGPGIVIDWVEIS